MATRLQPGKTGDEPRKNLEEDVDDDDDDDEDPKGLCGLQNLGNTCYMNGALQALSNCQQLTRFVLDCNGYIKTTGLCRSYSELIREIWEAKRDQPYAVPSSILRGIRGIYPAFRGYTQQDTQEFLRCFLEQLHEELKQPASLTDRIQWKEQEDQTVLDQLLSSLVAPTLTNGDIHNNICNNVNHDNIINNATTEAPTTRTTETETTTNPTDINNEHQLNNTINNCNDDVGNKCVSLGKSDTIARKKKDIKYKSIISDTFDFKILSSVQCSNCNNISTTKETFKDLSLPIPTRDHPYWLRTSPATFDSPGSTSTTNLSSEETNELKGELSTDVNKATDQNQDQWNDNNNADEQITTAIRPINMVSINSAYKWFWDWLNWISGWLWGPSVSLQDCLSIFFGADPLEGDNEYSCEKCAKKNRGVKYLKILELPEILCIHFKRYESINSAKITTHVSFPLVGLQLAPYMSEESDAQCTTYNLVACICHHGSALLTGHYTTYALNCFDDQWYEYDDQSVSMVQSYQVESCEAYILFYQKATMDDTTDRRRTKASELLMQNQHRNDLKRYLISRQWINRFNTFVDPGPITNHDFLCEHNMVPKIKWHRVVGLYHPVPEPVWRYLHGLYGGGPECCELVKCSVCWK